MSDGILFAISAPSGCGKSSIIALLLEQDQRLRLSCSVTTRSQRDTEVDGLDYTFISVDQFYLLQQSNAFLESAQVYNNYYGTLKSEVDALLTQKHDVVLDIDPQGVLNIKQHFRVVSIYIMPPSIQELQTRLLNRQKTTKESVSIINQRMQKAVDQLLYCREYEYIIINDVLHEAVANIQAIIVANRMKREYLDMPTMLARYKDIED